MHDSTASVITPGHFVRRTAKGNIPPIILTSPHSGRAYPNSFLKSVIPNETALRRAEDAWIDRLWMQAAEQHDLSFITARWGRTFIDLNRNEDELDPALISGRASFPVGDRVRAGLGVLPRVVVPGVPIYRSCVSAAEAQRRIDLVHRPYHRAIARHLRAAHEANGIALLIDCHSMPSPKTPEAQIVIGDRFGRSAGANFISLTTDFFSSHMPTARNKPYAGGYTTEYYGRPDEAVHALQIELDRSLYMDAATLELRENFTTLSAMLSDFVGELLAYLSAGDAIRIAAE